jgi:NADP-dependent 3-hydroxy acid dehydrogenase YdfG
MQGSWALITGASSGFGKALSRQLARRGVNLLITARREERLKALAAELVKEHKIQVETLVFDIRDRAACEAAVKQKANLVCKVSILINNAGLARGTEPLPAGKFDDWDQMIDTNIKGLLYITRLVLPSMIERNEGHIVNLGSIAGRWVPPGMGVYSATKFAVRALSDGLRVDLLGKNIRVTNIEPGIAETEFAQVRAGDESTGAAMYRGLTPLSANDVAEAIMWCLDRPAHVNIHEMVIFPTAQAGVGAHYTYREPR